LRLYAAPNDKCPSRVQISQVQISEPIRSLVTRHGNPSSTSPPERGLAARCPRTGPGSLLQ
jgi:hypothetical protein